MNEESCWEEVKRLREQIQLLHDTWFADAEMASDVDERMTELLKYDGDKKFTKPLMPRREFLLTVEEMIDIDTVRKVFEAEWKMQNHIYENGMDLSDFSDEEQIAWVTAILNNEEEE